MKHAFLNRCRISRAKSLLAAGLLALLAGATAQAAAPVFINEVLANNVSVRDQYGETPDWIEIYNASDFALDLVGMSLTSDPNSPTRYVFPEGSTIYARGFFVVYFDGGSPRSALNTGTGLNASGDRVYLYSQANELIDSVDFGIQVADYSISRLQVTGGSWYLSQPTPRSENSAVTLSSAIGLKINEWMAAPQVGEDWFEVFNPNPNPVAIGGCWLTDNLSKPKKHQIKALSFIGSGSRGYEIFWADKLTNDGPNHVAFNLDDTGESIGLYTSSGSKIDSVTFLAQAEGVSEGLFPDGAAGTKRRFPGGATPGDSNYLPLSNAIINEILTHTDPPLEDIVELYNPTDEDADISGYYLSDSPSNWKKYQLPANSIVPKHGYFLISQTDFGDTNSLTGFNFNSSEGDTAYLSQADAAGNLTGYRSQVRFGPAPNAVSFGRYVNSQGTVYYPLQTRLTLGDTNAGPIIGPVVITEIMYHPPDLLPGIDNTNHEFVELHNIASTNVPLFDPDAATNTWRFRGGVTYRFPTNVTMLAGSYLLVVSFNPTNAAVLADFKQQYQLDDSVRIFGPYNGKLGNGGDTVELFRPDVPQPIGHINQGFVPYYSVDRVDYFDSAPWPTTADGVGSSLQRRNPFTFANDPANWFGGLPTAGRFNTGGVSDNDKDGLPDDWELTHGLNPQDPTDASVDSDRDGLTNMAEFLAGTDPQNPLSVFKASQSRFAGGQSEFRFAVVAGKTYTVQYRDSLKPAAWVKSRDLYAPSTGFYDFSEPIGTNRARFYRLVTPALP